jgi:hypothetical protein
VRREARPCLLAAAALSLAPATGAQSVAPAFSGRYQLALTLSGGCPAAMQVGPLTVAMTVTESASGSALEVAGQSASPAETPADGRFVLLRRGDQLHGPLGSGEALGLVTGEGYLLWLRLVLDGGAATATGGRARASGTAFGEVDLGVASDPAADSENCLLALDHRWTLEPI